MTGSELSELVDRKMIVRDAKKGILRQSRGFGIRLKRDLSDPASAVRAQHS